MEISGTSKIAINIAATKDLDLSTPQDSFNPTSGMSNTYANGTGANQANQHWHDSESLASGENTELDLAGGLTDAFGDVITFTKIKVLYIKNRGTDSTLLVGNADSHQWLPLLGGPAETIKIPPGGRLLIEVPSADGLAVGAGSADILRLEHEADGSQAIPYDIFILGVV